MAIINSNLTPEQLEQQRAASTSGFGGVQSQPQNFAPAPSFYDAQGNSGAQVVSGVNALGQRTSNSVRIGRGSAGKQTAGGPTRGEIEAGLVQGAMAPESGGWGGVQNTPVTKPAPAPAAGSGNWGGVQNTPGAPTPSGQPMTRPFTPDGAGSTTNASGTSGFRQWDVTAPQTVQQQAAGIIAADSPLMQQARGRAMQQMNERGLINSSLGVQAAQDAVMERALQIAAPDAATNAQAAQFNANQGNAWNLAQQEIAQRDKQFAADMEYKRWALSQNFENEKQLREVEMKYRGELESDSGFQRQYNTYIDGIFQIDMNKDLDPETKLQMKKQLGQQLDDYVTLNKLGINMDFSDYWASKAPPAEEKPKVDPGTGNTGGVERNFDLP